MYCPFQSTLYTFLKQFSLTLIFPFDFKGAQKSSHEENIPLDQKPVDRVKTSIPQSATQPLDPITSIKMTSAPITAVDSISSTNKIDSHTTDVSECESDPSPTSDSYTVPGSTMKETHIFTPIKANPSNDISLPTLVANGTKPRSDIPSDDIEQTITDTIFIKESVVKKEYRDVEYEPNKLSASTDDFSDFQFVQPITIPNNQIIEPIQCLANVEMQSNSINSLPELSTDKFDTDTLSNDAYSSKLADLPKPATSYVMNSFNNSTFKSLPSIDNGQIPSNLQNVSSTAILSNGNQNEFDFYSFNNSTHKNTPSGSIPNDTNSFDCPKDSMEIFSISSIDHKQMHSLSNSVQNPSIASNSHDLFKQQSNINATMNTINSNKYVDSSDILTPQSLNMQSKTIINNNELSIQWPEPGINSDQLNELERRFSIRSSDSKLDKINEPKENADTIADDEWTDFVSVVQPQTPITNILNKNLLKQQQQSNNDEDDWSEFVSSSAPSNLQRSPNSIAIDSNTNYESMFKSWNTQATSQHFGNYILQSNTMRQSGNPSNIELNALQMAQKPIAPSIISLPDLGFVAPKSLINMPNMSKAKK